MRGLRVLCLILVAALGWSQANVSARVDHGEVKGVIVSMDFVDPIEEEYIIGYYTIRDSQGKQWRFEINRDTHIHDKLLRTAHAVYFRKGQKVKVVYNLRSDRRLEAKDIYELLAFAFQKFSPRPFLPENDRTTLSLG